MLILFVLVITGHSQRVKSIQPRIIGGVKSNNGEWPWMGTLVNKQSQNLFSGSFCGVSLIHPRWAITAAHCLVDRTTNSLDVVFGINRLDDSTFIRVAVAEIIVHPNFDTINFDSDIALLLLEEPIELESLSLIDDDSLEKPGIFATTIGWGATNSAGTVFPIDLQQANVPVVDLANANSISSWNGILTNNMLPAGYASGGIDSCVGDSGGPLIVIDQINHKPYLVGITSFGSLSGCGIANLYGIYTRVNNFRNWVMNIVSPKYLNWEIVNKVKGRFRDFDNDQVNNFIEYAFGSDPLIADYSHRPLVQVTTNTVDRELELTYFRRQFFDDLDYNIENSNNLKNWNKISINPKTLPASAIDSEIEQVSYNTNINLHSSVAEFLRLNVTQSNNIEHAPRQIKFPTSFSANLSQLSDSDSQRLTGNYFSQSYILTDMPIGKDITFGFISTDFTGIIRVLNSNTNSILFESIGIVTSPKVDIQLTVQGNVDYQFQVTTVNENQTGNYNLYMNKILNFPVNVTDVLTNAEIDPLFTTAIETYYKTDYIVDGLTVGNTVSVSLVSNEFDAFLQVFDILTKEELFSDDDSGGGVNASISFTVGNNISYLIRVSTALAEETGNFTLTIKE